MLKSKHTSLSPDEFDLLPSLAQYLRDKTKNGGKVKNVNIQNDFKDKIPGGDKRRTVQMMIHELRITGRVKNLLASSGGYYISSNKTDKEAYKVALKRRINSLVEVYQSIN